ncbi:MAG: PBSX family phage terminase large subunit [Oscillospiraceae bacterium]|nr:PBSX family phage terminase large subunit [Oscillospiraceae bacterium]
MIYQKFSKRQLLAATWWNRPAFSKRDAIICDGAVRSGKTVCMVDGFFLWAMCSFDGQNFALCGKTVESLRRNIVLNLQDWLGGVLSITEKRNENKLVVTCDGRTNTFFLFGGRDESSYMLIQGITLAGVLMDEVALMPRSFVEQACARCSVAGSKLWFNCNPAGPEHWFYKEWILNAKGRNALHLHFTMEDNLSLAEEIKARYRGMFTGVFYRRYILGEWCIAEGLVYEFDKDLHITGDLPDSGDWYISCDYGTLNPFSAGLWCVNGGRAVRVAEYYYSGRSQNRQMTDEEYYEKLEELAGDRDIHSVVVDPSAASFIACIRRHGRFSVRKARNDVLPGIRLTAAMLHAGVIRIGAGCADAIREFGLYHWEEKGEVDKPIKENDHAMDDIRYFCATIMRRNREARKILGGICDEEIQTLAD